VRPFPAAANGGKWQISGEATAGSPIWSRTAKELFYVSDEHIMVVSYSVSGDRFSPGPPRRWSEAPIQVFGYNQHLDLAPDGKRFVAFPAPETSGEKVNLHATFVLNFFDEMKRRMP